MTFGDILTKFTVDALNGGVPRMEVIFELDLMSHKLKDTLPSPLAPAEGSSSGLILPPPHIEEGGPR